MDILHLTPEAHELLQNWGEENRLLVDSVLPYNKSYFKKLCLDYGSQCMLDSEGPLRVYIEAKPHHEEFRAKFCGKQITKGKIIPTYSFNQGTLKLLFHNYFIFANSQTITLHPSAVILSAIFLSVNMQSMPNRIKPMLTTRMLEKFFMRIPPSCQNFVVCF